jgi:hypothetical protein
MADHGKVEYATATGNDLPAHEATYEGFLKFAYFGTVYVICIVIGLAIGGVSDRWGLTFGVILIATLVAFHGVAFGSRAPIAVVAALSLLVLALV